MLNKFFELVFVPDDWADLPTNFYSFDQNDVDITVTEEGIYKLLLNIDISKSCGPDDIPGILLKTFSSCIVKSLVSIFQYSLTNSRLPNVWKRAKVKPIF